MQRQWRKRGMRVTIIRIVINFPPEKAYNVALGIGGFKYCFQQRCNDDQNVDGKEGIRTEGDRSDATIADGREDGADKVH